MFCPKCGDEFRPGFTEGPDCMVALVDQLPKEGDDEGLVEIGRFETLDEAVRARAALDGEGIAAVVSNPDARPLLRNSGQDQPPPVALLVLEEQADRARSILETTSPDEEVAAERPRREISRPPADEYDPEAARYMSLVPGDVRILDFLDANVRETEMLALSIGDEALSRPYGPGKWTGKELLVHVSDDERIYAYRALRFARGDQTELPGFAEKDYAFSSRANDRRLEDILRELVAVRQATIELFDGLDDDALKRFGVANGHVMSVRAAAYHIAGHELWHVQLLRDGYPESASAD